MRWIRATAAALALVALAGCGDTILLHQEGTYEYTLHGGVHAHPGAAQWIGYLYVSSCSGISQPDPNRVQWYVVDSIVEHPTGRRMAGLANYTQGRIYIDRAWWGDWRIAGSEILHLLLGPGIREGDPEYDRCHPMRYDRIAEPTPTPDTP